MDRSRLTITLKQDLLDKVDSIIDGVKIRNRSHAIEYLLSQSLGPQVKQAVILAGGQGVKMRPLTYELPKPLVPVKGKPVIDYNLELLKRNGIEDVILAIGHLGDKIRDQVGSGQRYGLRANYSHEDHPLGSGGALRQSLSLVDSYPLLVMNGDVLADLNLKDLINFHQERDYLVTMVLTVAADTAGFGKAKVRGDRVVEFVKKDQSEDYNLVNAGIYLVNQGFSGWLPEQTPSDLEDVFIKLAQEGLLAGYIFEGDWFEISTPKNYEKAIKNWQAR